MQNSSQKVCWSPRANLKTPRVELWTKTRHPERGPPWPATFKSVWEWRVDFVPTCADYFSSKRLFHTFWCGAKALRDTSQTQWHLHKLKVCCNTSFFFFFTLSFLKISQGGSVANWGDGMCVDLLLDFEVSPRRLVMPSFCSSGLTCWFQLVYWSPVNRLLFAVNSTLFVIIQYICSGLFIGYCQIHRQRWAI